MGYIPFDQDAANLFFQLVSSRYEHASMILTSNLPFARWGDVFGDLTIASAMIDRSSTTPSSFSLKGNSYRLKKHQPAASTAQPNNNPGAPFSIGTNGPIFGGVNGSYQAGLRDDHRTRTEHSSTSPPTPRGMMPS